MRLVKTILSFFHRTLNMFWLLIRILLFIIISLFLSEVHLFGTLQSTKTTVGEITDIKGQVFVLGKDLEKFETAQVGQILYEGDVVKTGQGSQATISFFDESILNLKENTMLTLQGKPKRRKQKTVAQARTNQRSKNYKKGSKVGKPLNVRKLNPTIPSKSNWASGPPETNILKSSDPVLKKTHNNEHNAKELEKKDMEIKEKKNKERMEIEKEKDKEES